MFFPANWKCLRSIDFGYRNPFVCQWWAVDTDDRMYLYREIYMTGRTVRAHAEQINYLSEGEVYVDTLSDHDASDRATLEEHGIYTTAARKDVTTGIEAVQERLRIQGDGKPRLYFMRDSLVEVDVSLRERFKPTCTEEEILAYVYPDVKEGKTDDERPVKVDDHGMDAMRYAVMGLENVSTFTTGSKRYI